CPVADHGQRPAVDHDGDEYRRIAGAVVTDVAHGPDQSAGSAIPDTHARLGAPLVMQVAKVPSPRWYEPGHVRPQANAASANCSSQLASKRQRTLLGQIGDDLSPRSWVARAPYRDG